MSFSEWEKVKLGNVINFKNGRKKPDDDGDIPIYGGNGILGYTNNFNNENAVVVGRVGAYCGSVYYEPGKCWISDNAISAQPINGNSVNYIYYALKSLKLNERRIGTGQPLLTQSILNNIDTIYPMPEEQKAIAATLSCLDDKIELNNKINKNLEEIAQVIFKSWFADFEPFQDGEFEESELGRIPKGWRVVDFLEISTVQNGYAFKSSDYQPDGCNMIRTTNIGSDGFVDNIDLINLPYNFLHESKYQNFRFEAFDTVLVMVGASVGKIGIITEKNIPSLQNQNMWRFRPTVRDVSPIYIHHTVKLINDKVKNWSSGSARDFYRKDSFQRAKCLYPSREALMGFRQLVEPIFNLISINLMKNENLKDIRDSLLPKLMSGEIRVPIEEVH